MAKVLVPKTVYVRWYCETCTYHHVVKAKQAQLDETPAYGVLDLGTTDLRCKKLRYKEEEPAVVEQVYKPGQRVRIEWPDGTTVEGVLTSNVQVGRTAFMPYEVGHDGRNVTILSEPRPDEPTGLGAVVRASVERRVPEPWVREPWGGWVSEDGSRRPWSALIDPVVLHEGWVPE